MKMRLPEERQVSPSEVFLESLALLLVGALAALAMWALPVWLIVGLYAGVVAGSFVMTGIIEWMGRRHMRRSRLAHQHRHAVKRV